MNDSPASFRARRWLVAVLLGGLAVRIALLVWFREEPLYIFDEIEYNQLAVNLVQTGSFRLVDGPTSMRPPLYPATVAAIYACCGVENYQAVRIFQAILDLGTVLLVYLLGKELYDRRAGVWAAGLYCFYPSMLGQVNLLLTETLFTFLLVAACLAVTRFFQRDRLPWIAAAGVLIGLAALTRSILWLFPPVLGLYVLIVWKASFPRRLAAAAILVAAFAATIAPWSIRCTRLEKTFIAIDTMGGRNLMVGNYEYTPLRRSWAAIEIEGPEAWYNVLAAQDPQFKRLTQGQRDKIAMRYGVHFILTHPGLTLQRSLVKLSDFWQLERALVAGMGKGWFGNLSKPAILLLTILIFGSYALAMVLGVFGAALAPPENRRAFWFLLLLIAFVCGLHSLVFAHSRYHLPLMPLVLVFAAGGLAQGRALWQRRGSWAFRMAVALTALLVAAWSWEILVVDFDRFMNILRT